jgi:hypothetical protein
MVSSIPGTAKIATVRRDGKAYLLFTIGAGKRLIDLHPKTLSNGGFFPSSRKHSNLKTYGAYLTK